MAKRDVVLVTGAGGFIGGHLTAYLLGRGLRVRCADIKPLAEWYQVHPGTETHAGPARGDCRDFRVCRSLVAGVADVYQLAADMGGMGFIENNKALCMLSVFTNTNMLLASQEAGVTGFFYSSSACVYNAEKQGSPKVTALKEADAYPALPEDGYGWEKLFSERMCRHFREDFGLNTKVARFHNVYGPHGTWEGGREKAPAAVCRKVVAAVVSGNHEIEIWGDGKQSRSFTYIDDCVKGIDLIMQSKIMEPINLGSHELVTINQLVDIAEQIAGVRLTRRYKLNAPLGVAGRNSDNRKIRQYLNWEPSISLRNGMEQTYRWIHDQFIGKYGRVTARKSQRSIFDRGSQSIPGDGFNPESRFMDTWRLGIPAGYGRPKRLVRRKGRGFGARRKQARMSPKGAEV